MDGHTKTSMGRSFIMIRPSATKMRKKEIHMAMTPSTSMRSPKVAVPSMSDSVVTNVFRLPSTLYFEMDGRSVDKNGFGRSSATESSSDASDRPKRIV